MVKHGATFNPYEQVSDIEADSPEQAIVKAFNTLHRGEKYATAVAEHLHDDTYEVRIKIA